MTRVLLGLVLLGCAEPIAAPVAPRLSVVSSGQPSVIVQVTGDPELVAQSHGITPSHVYRYALNGFAASVSDVARAGLLRDARVSKVSDDGVVSINEIWNLDRIDQRQLPLNNSFAVQGTGAGVNVYIMDTGILPSHTELSGRVSYGISIIEDGWGLYDCNGHGTHVAGTVGGKTYGVARSASFISVRVLDCGGHGTWSQVIAGVDWVTANAVKPAIVNMSLGGDLHGPMNDAVRNSIASGITYVLSAGNNNGDACLQSPASTPEALTIGATDNTDTRAYFSNWGSCVDLFAPGVGVLSSYNEGDNSTIVLSGTSMAAPHVTGVAALFLERRPSASPGEVADSVRAYATKSIVKNSLSANAHLLYSGTDTAVVAPPEEPPQPKCPKGKQKQGKC